jgi:two-component system OmpR family sensor kinase
VRRLRWWPVTLRARLLVLLAGCLVVAFAVVAAVTALALRTFLVDRLDQQLAQASDRFALSLEHPGGADHDPDDRVLSSVVGQSSGTLGARIKDGTVTAVGVVGRDADDEPGASTRSALARLHRGGPRSVDLPELGDYRVLVSAGRDGDLLVTGLPEAPVGQTIERLWLIEALVFAGVLALTGALAAVAVRLSLRPLHRVGSTALEVSDLPLSTGEVELPDPVDAGAPRSEAGQLALAFNRMLEHVQHALRARQSSEARLRRFIADASHELRTPVAVIRSHAEYAQRTGADTETDTGVDRALERIVAESDRMATIVDELLTLARLDAERPLAAEEVDLARTALEAVEDAHRADPRRQWRLQLPREPAPVLADAQAAHQVLANLLANCRQHTPPGTTVTVTVRPGAHGTVLEVRDDGPGIPAELQPRLFERFVRGHASAEGGAGLGLSIVAALVAAMAGTVTATSAPGDTRVRVELRTAG